MWERHAGMVMNRFSLTLPIFSQGTIADNTKRCRTTQKWQYQRPQKLGIRWLACRQDSDLIGVASRGQPSRDSSQIWNIRWTKFAHAIINLDPTYLSSAPHPAPFAHAYMGPCRVIPYVGLAKRTPPQRRTNFAHEIINSSHTHKSGRTSRMGKGCLCTVQ